MTLLEREKQLSVMFRPGTWWQTYSWSHLWEIYTGSSLKPWNYGYTRVGVTVFNCESHSGSGGSDFPAAFRTWKGQRYFSNDWNRFQKVLAPFQTQNRRKHFNCLTISYVRLNLSLPFVTAPITIHYKLHSGPSGGLIWVYLCPWYIYIYPTYKHLSRLCPSKTAAELWATPALFLDSVRYGCRVRVCVRALLLGRTYWDIQWATKLFQ